MRWEGEGSPPWSFRTEKLWEWKVAGAEGGGPEGPNMSALMQHGAVTSWVPNKAAPASCGGRWQCDAGPLGPPTPLPHFPLPLPNVQRARGSCNPLPHPSPKAQAPWQRPRRQGGVCQRHLSLTSSITGHHGNTHDSTQEGLPVQPSLLPPSSLS